jgi:hypothetical protein
MVAFSVWGLSHPKQVAGLRQSGKFFSLLSQSAKNERIAAAILPRRRFLFLPID